MAKPRRKKRTAIRTAAGTVQDQFVARMGLLRDDPLQALPVCTQGEPKPLQKIRTRIEKMGAKPGFLDRRDKGIVGAVANAMPLADLTAVPRIADHKVGGKRRFYLQRGQVGRSCSMGVQNFDDPLALMMAYRDMAKDQGLHFFAGSKLWCTGPTPVPPAAWLADLCDVALSAEAQDRFGCGHGDVDRVALRFHGGPAIVVCPNCGKKAGHMHGRIGQRYAGPKQRQPVEVLRLRPDGTEAPLDAESVAAYRGGVLNEAMLLARG